MKEKKPGLALAAARKVAVDMELELGRDYLHHDIKAPATPHVRRGIEKDLGAACSPRYIKEWGKRNAGWNGTRMRLCIYFK